MKPKKKKLDYRKQVEGAVICLKAFRSWDDQEGCSQAERHKERNFCRYYSFDGTCDCEDD